MQKNNKRTALLALLLSAAVTARATGYEQLLQKIEQYNKGTEMSYGYSITLKDLDKGQVLDSMRGKLYASGIRYLDSNARGLTLRSDSYFCKLLFKNKTAEVYNSEQIRAMLGGKIPDQPQSLFSMSPEIFKKYSRITIDSTTDKKHYRIRVLLKLQEMPEVNLVVAKADYHLSSMQIELRDRGQENYRRIIRLYDIKRTVPPEVLRPNRLFSATGSKITLLGKYSSYKLLSAAR